MSPLGLQSCPFHKLRKVHGPEVHVLMDSVSIFIRDGAPEKRERNIAINIGAVLLKHRDPVIELFAQTFLATA